MTELSAKRPQEFSRDKEAPKDADHRSHVRYQTYAKVKFRGIMEQESLLKDISVTGCRVECTSLADIQIGSGYTLEVIPEAGSQIGRFDLEVKAVWISMAGYSGDVGFTITASPKGKLFQRYVDYLSWKGSHH
ncbi:MAG: PilZ domain-containing protein [Treponema sp.]|jgi:hypothetical protein|nr:PilZ domain-containing protein [Treponema sp.]